METEVGYKEFLGILEGTESCLVCIPLRILSAAHEN